MYGCDGEMTDGDEDNTVGVPSAFQGGQGFPTPGESQPEPEPEPEPEEVDDGYPYSHQVLEPEPVTHPFEKPKIPDAPRSRDELARAVKQYAKYVLYEYPIELEYDRVKFKTDGRFTRALGKCGTNGYHRARVRISSHHYLKRGYSWDDCKETIRHELVHAWQARWLGYTSHGPTFVEKAKELDCERLGRYDGKREPKYVAYCQNCGNTYKKQRMCKSIRNPYTKCSSCKKAGYDVDEIEENHVWIVFDNDDWHKVMP